MSIVAYGFDLLAKWGKIVNCAGSQLGRNTFYKKPCKARALAKYVAHPMMTAAS
jgi:hypothetical protein